MMQGNFIVRRKGEGTPPALVILTGKVDKEDDRWVGTILELGVSAYADTIEAVREELAEAVLLQLNEVERLGFMDEYLKAQGVRLIFLRDDEEEGEPHSHWEMIPVGA